MSADPQTAREDLAFLRALLGDDETSRMRRFGEAYLSAGVIYGVQLLLHAAQALGLVPPGPILDLAIALGPTVLFIPVLIWIIRRNRRSGAAGTTSKAIAYVFAVVGLSNIVLIAIIGTVAWQEKSLAIWLLYLCCVFVLQGAAWLFAFMMRRRAWFLWVALGWYACSIAMGLTLTAIVYYIVFAGIGMWLCMALPGYVTLRQIGR